MESGPEVLEAMGFLEEFKKEPQKGGAEPPSGSHQVAFEVEAQPAMVALRDYSQRLVEHLNRIGSDILTSYELEGGTDLTALHHAASSLSVEGGDLIRACALSWVCRADKGVEIVVPNKEAAERQQQYLWKHKLEFSSRKRSDDRWSLQIEAAVPVSFQFQLDPAKRKIRLRVMNHERLGVDSYSYNPDDINPLFLDELASYIMRKPNRFHVLSGDVVPEDTLMRLRQQIAQGKATRETDPESDAAQKGPSKPTKGSPKKGFLRGLFKS